MVRPAAIVRLAVLMALTALITVRGIVPAMSRLDADFPSYFTAAKIVADGGEVGRLYDTAWFQDQMRRYGVGVPQEGKFAPFPPPTALLLVPLAHAPPLTALRILTVVSALVLVLAAILVSKILSRPLTEAAVFVLLASYPICSTLRFGQPYILVSAASLLGYYAYTRRRPLLAGICFGVFVPLKYFPVLFLAYFGVRREWKVFAGGAAAILAVAAVSVLILGWHVHEVFLSRILGRHLIAQLALQGPFTTSFQSFDTLYRRLFLFDASSNPDPFAVLPGLEPVALAATKLTLFALALATIVRLSRMRGAAARGPSIGILGIAGLLLAPATATYHLVLLWLPLALLADDYRRSGAYLRAALVLGLYALIAFFPYRFTQPFEGRGALTILAYPRLILLLAMFVAACYFAWHPLRAGEEPAPRSRAATLRSRAAQ
jgi:glycosyl transferase family 87